MSDARRLDGTSVPRYPSQVSDGCESGSQETEQRARAEARVRALLSEGDPRGACTVAIESFGPEIYGFLLSVLRSEDLAQEAFSNFTEAVLRGLPQFRWQSSLRNWLYALGRHAGARARRTRARSRLQLSDPSFAELEAQIRSQTAPHLRTETRDAVRALRDRLSAEEQDLLVLRVDRCMSWTDIAEVSLGSEVSDEAIRREATAWRKRFERLKNKLQQLAVTQGLVRQAD